MIIQLVFNNFPLTNRLKECPKKEIWYLKQTKLNCLAVDIISVDFDICQFDKSNGFMLLEKLSLIRKYYHEKFGGGNSVRLCYVQGKNVRNQRESFPLPL